MLPLRLCSSSLSDEDEYTRRSRSLFDTTLSCKQSKLACKAPTACITELLTNSQSVTVTYHSYLFVDLATKIQFWYIFVKFNELLFYITISKNKGYSLPHDNISVTVAQVTCNGRGIKGVLPTTLEFIN